MDTPTYPGKGLSLSQLAFALNQELKRVAFSAGFTPDSVSKLDRDISTVSATVREWKNSFVPINRIPSDILSLIPTHLSSEQDRFRATFVCRHWRRTFLQHGILWSQLFLGNGEDYVSTLLKRANGSALEIVTNHDAPPGTTALLSPHVQQIRYLKFASNCWTDILAFSEDNPRPLPLLHTLEIHITDVPNPRHQPLLLTTPSPPLFSGAVNLQELIFTSTSGPNSGAPFKSFVFPNLTTLGLGIYLTTGSNISDLLEFLKASPTLQKVEVEIAGRIISDIPREMVVVLPNVKTFSLFVSDDGWRFFDPAQISCPGAKYTSLTHRIWDWDMAPGLVLFPPPDSWEAITRQYSTSPVEEVTLEATVGQPWAIINYAVEFQSSDATVIRLDCGVADTSTEENIHVRLSEMSRDIFSQACRTIRNHPLLSRIKRLHISHGAMFLSFNNVLPVADVVRELFGSLGPLDELTIHGYDLKIFLAPFIDHPEYRTLTRVFPPVRELTISKAWAIDGQWCMDGIVELAKSQHELEKPFERLTVRTKGISTTFAERLRQWVGTVDCCEL